MKQTIIMHIDMNSYFASVQQQVNPFLRGRPVGVCAYLSENGCIIASSVEAKQQGVKTGMRVRDARKLCKDIFLIENDPPLYRSTTKKIFDIFAQYSDTIEAYSIDEAFIDFTGWIDSFDKAEEIAKEIQVKIKEEVGEWLKCSIGISYTKFLAKFAGDITGHNSILLITKENLEEVLRDQPLTEAWGINVRIASRLQYLGIHTLLDLKKYPVSNLMTVLGKYGYFLWAHVNGIPVDSVQDRSDQKPKSIGHSYCLPKRTDDLSFLLPILYKLCERTGRRLRQKQLMADIVHVSMSYQEGGGYGKRYKLKYPFDTTEEIYTMAKKIVIRGAQKPLSLLAISVSGLQSFHHQMGIFEMFQGKERFRAIDKVNDKYGEFTIYRGTLAKTKDFAKDRVGFRKTITDF